MDGNCWWGRVACEMEDRIDEGTRVKGEGMNEIGGEACDVACTIVVITPPPPLLRQSTHSHSSSCSPLTNNRLTGRLLPLQSTGCWPPPDFFGPLATGRRLTQSTPWPTTEVDQLPSVVRHPDHHHHCLTVTTSSCVIMCCCCAQHSRRTSRSRLLCCSVIVVHPGYVSMHLSRSLCHAVHSRARLG